MRESQRPVSAYFFLMKDPKGHTEESRVGNEGASVEGVFGKLSGQFTVIGQKQAQTFATSKKLKVTI